MLIKNIMGRTTEFLSAHCIAGGACAEITVAAAREYNSHLIRRSTPDRSDKAEREGSTCLLLQMRN